MKKHFRTWGGFWKWNCVLIMPYFCWQLKQLGRNVDFLRSLNNRRGIIKAWSKCGYYCNLGQCYIWSTLHMPRRGLLVFLCNKCPPSLIRMPSAVIIMSHDLLRCLQASVRTNRFCTSVPVQVNSPDINWDRQKEGESEREKEKHISCWRHCVPCFYHSSIRRFLVTIRLCCILLEVAVWVWCGPESQYQE